MIRHLRHTFLLLVILTPGWCQEAVSSPQSGAFVPPLQQLVEQVAEQVVQVSRPGVQPPVVSVAALLVDSSLNQAWAGRLHQMLASRLSRDLRVTFKDSLVDTGTGKVEWVGRPSEKKVDYLVYLKLTCQDSRLVMGVTLWSVPDAMLYTVGTRSVPFPSGEMELNRYAFPQESSQGWDPIFALPLSGPAYGLIQTDCAEATVLLPTQKGVETLVFTSSGMKRGSVLAWPAPSGRTSPSRQMRIAMRPCGPSAWRLWHSERQPSLYLKIMQDKSLDWFSLSPQEAGPEDGWELLAGTDLWRNRGTGIMQEQTWLDWLLLPEELGSVWVVVDRNWHLLLVDREGTSLWRSSESGGDRLALAGSFLAWSGEGAQEDDVLHIYRMDGGRMQRTARLQAAGLITELTGGQWNGRPGFWGVTTDRQERSWKLVFWGQS